MVLSTWSTTFLGIDLLDLNRCNISEASATTFYCIEAIGDNKARITHKKNNYIKYNGHAPLSLRFEAKKELTFISNDRDKDLPSVLTIEGPNKNFEEGSLAEMFYPNRKPPISIPRNKLDIGNNNPKAKFVLDLDSKTTLTPTLLESVQQATNNTSIDFDSAVELKKMIEDTTKDLVESISDGHKEFYDDDIATEALFLKEKWKEIQREKQAKNSTDDDETIDLDKEDDE